ncbi:MAG: SDR family NAD(P)-dependent oxidoreductase [Thermomicrobiales bacterium]
MSQSGTGFDGKVAIVTGGARGIGLAISRRLAAGGAKVALADVDGVAAQTAADQLDGVATGISLDVTNPDQWQQAIEDLNAHWGAVSILVNNAGIAGQNATTWELSLEEWNRVLAIDLTGVFLGCRAAVPGMIDAGYGRIVNVASIAGKEGNPNAAPYSAAKAGVIGLTKSLAKEVATKGILVNAITPAVIATEILQQLTKEHIDYMTSRIPMGRVGQPEEVAELVSFLASDRVSFSTGAVFDISGGRATY